MAAPEDTPRNADGTFENYTWGESGVNTTTPPPTLKRDDGFKTTDSLPASELNWLQRTPARFARSGLAEHPRASQGLVTSHLSPEGGGFWSDNGVGGALEVFCSSAAGGPTVQAADVWVDLGTGAKGLQVRVSKAAPITLTATSDNYVFIPQDEALVITDGGGAGQLTVTAVPVADPAPATPIGTVPGWVLETDATNLVDQTILLPTIPAFKTIGFEGIGVLGSVTISADLDVDGVTMLKGDVELGDAIGDAIDVKGTLDIQQPASGTNLDLSGNLTVDGDATLGDAAGDSIQVPGTPTFQTAINLSNVVPAAGQISRDGDLRVVWHDGTGVLVGHASTGGFLRASGTVTTATGAAASNTDLVTSVRSEAPVNLLVTVRGYALRAAAGNASFQIEQSDAAVSYSALGVSRALPIDSTIWTFFSLTRTMVGPDAIDRLYRLNLNGSGQNIQIRDAVVEVNPA